MGVKRKFKGGKWIQEAAEVAKPESGLTQPISAGAKAEVKPQENSNVNAPQQPMTATEKWSSTPIGKIVNDTANKAMGGRQPKKAAKNPYDYSGSGIAPETIKQNNERTGWMQPITAAGNASMGINENTQGGMAATVDPSMLGGQVVKPEDIQGVNHEAAPDASATAQYIQQRNYLGTGSGAYDKQGNAIDFSDFSWGSGAAESDGSSAGSGKQPMTAAGRTVDPYWDGVKWEDIELWAKDRGIEATGDELEKMLAAAGIPFYSEDRQDLDEATRQANLRKLYGWDAFDPKANAESWKNSPIGQIVGKAAEGIKMPEGADLGTGAGSGNASMGINENTQGSMAANVDPSMLGGKIGGGVSFDDLMRSLNGDDGSGVPTANAADESEEGRVKDQDRRSRLVVITGRIRRIKAGKTILSGLMRRSRRLLSNKRRMLGGICLAGG